MDAVWLVAGARSAFGRFGGALCDVTMIDLGRQVLTSTLERAGWSGRDPEELYVGVAMLEGGYMVPARQIAVEAGLPISLPTLTVDRACCSGLTGVGLARRAIALGSDAIACLGIETMSRTPRLLHETRFGTRRGDLVAEDLLLMRSPIAGEPIARYVGKVALEYGVDREAQDRWALASHQRYHLALEEDYFLDEIVPVRTPAGVFELDESPRPDTSAEKLARLPTVYDSPTVTAGNAPGLNDGAAAALVASDAYVERTSATPMARLVDYEQIAGEADSSAYLPGIAIRRLLDRAALSPDQLDVIEINEAFAATPPVSLRVLADGDKGLEEELMERTNPNGGAVALGHPTGASGTRLLVTAARELQRRGGRWAAVAICGGFGQTDAMLVERAV